MFDENSLGAKEKKNCHTHPNCVKWPMSIGKFVYCDLIFVWTSLAVRILAQMQMKNSLLMHRIFVKIRRESHLYGNKWQIQLTVLSYHCIKLCALLYAFHQIARECFDIPISKDFALSILSGWLFLHVIAVLVYCCCFIRVLCFFPWINIMQSKCTKNSHQCLKTQCVYWLPPVSFNHSALSQCFTICVLCETETAARHNQLTNFISPDRTVQFELCYR